MMKKRIIHIVRKMSAAALLGILVCFLTYCASESEAFSEFAEGTTINGIDVSGMSVSQAEEYISSAIENYSLDITLTSAGASEDETAADETQADASQSDEADSEDAQEESESEESEEEDSTDEENASDSETEEGTTSVVCTIDGSDISLAAAQELSFSELLSAQKEAYKALEEGESLAQEDLELTYEDLFTYDENAVSELAAEFVSGFEIADEASNAVLSYDEEAGEYVVVSETYAGDLSQDTLESALLEAVEALEETLDISDMIEVPAVTAENETLLSSLILANSYLEVELTYTFTVNSGTETITKEDIVSWLVYDEDSATINISNENLQAYVDDLASEYSVYNSTSQFLTTSGSYITVKVSSTGETVDSDALYNSIYANLSNCISGTFEAPYDETTLDDNDGIVDFDGTYVEVDLTNQHMYFYKNGSLLLESDFVSGKVSAGYNTPTGVFTIKSKETNRYLTGETYRSWVYFWMPFNGGVGFHDATWRSSFGRTIYLRNGSHGCINLPYAAAKSLYNYVSVGTYVVVYGGETEVASKSQTVSVASQFEKTDADSSFSLNASTSGDGELTYSSDDTSVVTVDEEGNVTIVGTGEATVTVTAAETSTYYEAQAQTTITVSHDYEYYNASWSSDYSTCTITIKCSACGQTKSLTASVTSKTTKEATVSSTGTKEYTASATYNGVKYTATKTVTTAKLEAETQTTTQETTQEQETSDSDDGL